MITTKHTEVQLAYVCCSEGNYSKNMRVNKGGKIGGGRNTHPGENNHS